jgi:hypothetical protein
MILNILGKRKEKNWNQRGFLSFLKFFFKNQEPEVLNKIKEPPNMG